MAKHAEQHPAHESVIGGLYFANKSSPLSSSVSSRPTQRKEKKYMYESMTHQNRVLRRTWR
jgi:hypothetical protein